MGVGCLRLIYISGKVLLKLAVIDRLMRKLLIVLTLLFLCASAYGQGVIVTVAGADWSFPGNGKLATDAPLGALLGVTVDLRGNQYIADNENHTVMKVSRDGILTVVAGNGLPGFTGDGGPATSASLSGPSGVAVDPSGVLYIAEIGNRRVRRVGIDGIITTIAGNGEASSSGDGGPATRASLGGRPFALALDAGGNLYIGDPDAHRIRRVTPTGLITTVAGTGQPGFSGDGSAAVFAELSSPIGVGVDANGNLYIADGGNFRVRKVTANGIITTIAGGGLSSREGVPATSAAMVPFGLTVDPAGNVYIADIQNFRIRRVGTDGLIRTVAGNGQQGFSGDGGIAVAASINFPVAAALDDSGVLYFADRATFRLRRVSTTGLITTVAGNGQYRAYRDGIASTDAPLRSPDGLGVDSAGNLYFAERDRARIRRVSPNGVISTVAGTGDHGFFGDNGPARNAALSFPRGLTADAAGNLYFSDGFNHRIRKITPAGIITTIAGNGIPGFAGDNGPGTGAAIILPEGVAADAAGNVYCAVPLGQRIRRISPTGIITTFAGNGKKGFAGDGGPASQASLSSPFGVAADSSGNVYIADTNNHRIRKVTPDGRITTVAGTGKPGFSGDGDRALLADLNNPVSIAVDSQGNIFVADQRNERVRKISSSGIITSVAGTGRTGSAGDGGPASSADLNTPNALAVDSGGNVYLSDTGNTRVRVVLTAAPRFETSPSEIQFTGNSTGPPTAPLDISVSGSVPGVPFFVTVKTADGGDWLDVGTVRGATPTALKVSADPSDLTPGTYTAVITISAPNANPAVRTVGVRFTVEPALPKKLSLIGRAFSFAFVEGGRPSSQSVGVTNLGGGVLEYTAGVTPKSGGNWLSLARGAGSASTARPDTLGMSANPTGLSQGTYSSLVVIKSPETGENEEVAVTMTVSPERQTVLLSSTGMTFTAVQGGGIVPSQKVAVLNAGQGVMGWSVVASTLSGSRGWLLVSPEGGSSGPVGLAPEVEVNVNPLGLSAGVYYGRILVIARGADNSPQSVSVVLNILPPFSNPGPVVQPAGLVFTGVAGGVSPGSQDVLVYNVSDRPISYTSGRLTLDGKNWFVHAPSNATVSPDVPTRVIVQPDVSGLAAGVYRGVLTLLFSDGSVRTVSLLFVVTASGSGPSLKGGEETRRDAGGCVPTRLLPIFTSLGVDFNVPLGWPASLEMRVVDDCGQPFVTGFVGAAFTNGDPPIVLVPLRDGRWAATWVVRRLSNSGVTVSAIAEAPGTSLRAVVSLPGAIRGNSPTPLVIPGSVSNSATLRPGLPVAPGSLISLFGTKLADSEKASARSPLELVLAGTSVAIAGRPMPLQFVADGQVNAVVPYDVPLNTTLQLVLASGATITVPEAVVVAGAQPGVFTKDGSGRGQGLVYVLRDGAIGPLAEKGAAVRAGDDITIVCAGLGAVSPTIEAGTAPARGAIHSVTKPVSVTIGEVKAEVSFAGLSILGAGLYEVRVNVPAGVEPGDLTPLVVTVDGQASPEVTIAVR